MTGKTHHLLALACVFWLGAQAPDTGLAADDPARPQVALPNPAAVFCVEQGGEYLLDTGQCLLADGTSVDGWNYYRAERERAAQLPNPAAVFCDAQQGTYDLTAGTCTLADGRVVDAWKLFRQHHADQR